MSRRRTSRHLATASMRLVENPATWTGPSLVRWVQVAMKPPALDLRIFTFGPFFCSSYTMPDTNTTGFYGICRRGSPGYRLSNAPCRLPGLALVEPWGIGAGTGSPSPGRGTRPRCQEIGTTSRNDRGDKRRESHFHGCTSSKTFRRSGYLEMSSIFESTVQHSLWGIGNAVIVVRAPVLSLTRTMW